MPCFLCSAVYIIIIIKHWYYVHVCVCFTVFCCVLECAKVYSIFCYALPCSSMFFCASLCSAMYPCVLLCTSCSSLAYCIPCILPRSAWCALSSGLVLLYRVLLCSGVLCYILCYVNPCTCSRPSPHRTVHVLTSSSCMCDVSSKQY